MVGSLNLFGNRTDNNWLTKKSNSRPNTKVIKARDGNEYIVLRGQGAPKTVYRIDPNEGFVRETDVFDGSWGTEMSDEGAVESVVSSKELDKYRKAGYCINVGADGNITYTKQNEHLTKPGLHVDIPEEMLN